MSISGLFEFVLLSSQQFCSSPPVQIAPFLKQVTGVFGSGVGWGLPTALCPAVPAWSVPAQVPDSPGRESGLDESSEALTPATSRISLTCCPFWHLFTLSSGPYFSSVTQNLTSHSPALLPFSQRRSWLFCIKMPTNSLS